MRESRGPTNTFFLLEVNDIRLKINSRRLNGIRNERSKEFNYDNSRESFVHSFVADSSKIDFSLYLLIAKH